MKFLVGDILFYCFDLLIGLYLIYQAMKSKIKYKLIFGIIWITFCTIAFLIGGLNG